MPSKDENDTTMPSSSDDIDTLHARFCQEYPEIDSTVIMVMLLDCGHPSADTLEALSRQLSELALHAQFENELRLSKDYDSSYMSESLFRDDETIPLESSSSSALSSTTAPLDFLKAAFPDTKDVVLQSALKDNAAGFGDDVDMEAVVQALLSWEVVRELEERGLNDTSEPASPQSRSPDWTNVEKKKNKRRKNKIAPIATTSDITKLKPGTTIQLYDIRQQNHRSPTSPSSASASSVDPWMHMTSVASTLSELLPSLSSNHFRSLFHNPVYTSPARALRAELARIETQSKLPAKFDMKLITFADMLGCSTQSGFEDARLCLVAAKCEVDTAWRLHSLLQDLDQAGVISHSLPASARTPASPTFLSSPAFSSSSSSPIRQASPSSTPTAPEWTKVMRRSERRALNASEAAMDPLAAFIPAYQGMPAGWRQNAGRQANEPDTDDELSEEDCRYWAEYFREKRDAKLREASTYWKKGRVGRGGEVALFYAEESREIDRKIRQWNIKAARAMVKSRQKETHSAFTVDLHGLTVNEALQIVREVVEKWYHSSSNSKPLNLITGRGNHSKSKVGVIGPAVQKDLERDGWRLTLRPGAIIVTGLRSG